MGNRMRRYGSAIMLAVLVSGGMAWRDADAKTGCTVVQGLSPTKTPATECPSPPCKPNAIGPLTQCIVNGEDPPMTDPLWDESTQGVMIMGGTMLSGKCGQPYFRAVINAPPVPDTNACEKQNTNNGRDNTKNKGCEPILNCPMSNSWYLMPRALFQAGVVVVYPTIPLFR